MVGLLAWWNSWLAYSQVARKPGQTLRICITFALNASTIITKKKLKTKNLKSKMYKKNPPNK